MIEETYRRAAEEIMEEKEMKTIELDVALNFLEENSKYSFIPPLGKTLSLGLFEFSNMIAIAILGTPQSNDLKDEFSSEILSFSQKYLSEDTDHYEKLISYYIEKYDPSDFVLRSDILKFEDTFVKDLNLKLIEIDGVEYFEWINENRTFYTYRISSSESNKYYYGVSHVKKCEATKTDCLNDGYFGSGGEKFQNWFSKYKKSITKEIVSLHSKSRNAYLEEKLLIGDLYKSDPLCLNSTSGGKDGGGLNLQLSKNSLRVQNCEYHGEVLHQRDSCVTCSAENRYFLKNCEIHGIGKHTKSGCVSCYLKKSFTEQICSNHGLTIFRKDCCVKCFNELSMSSGICEVHGEARFIGEKCYNCIDNGFTENFCELHGKTIHRGDSCVKCSVEKSFSIKECLVHGETTHRGDKCVTCASRNATSVQQCRVHGDTKHQGDKCSRCTAEKIITEQECKIHGLSKFRKDICIRCEILKSQNIRDCEFHGLSKHQGSRCCKCVGEKSSHTRMHKNKNVIQPNCRFCTSQLEDVQ